MFLPPVSGPVPARAPDPVLGPAPSAEEEDEEESEEGEKKECTRSERRRGVLTARPSPVPARAPGTSAGATIDDGCLISGMSPSWSRLLKQQQPLQRNVQAGPSTVL